MRNPQKRIRAVLRRSKSDIIAAVCAYALAAAALALAGPFTVSLFTLRLIVADFAAPLFMIAPPLLLCMSLPKFVNYKRALLFLAAVAAAHAAFYRPPHPAPPLMTAEKRPPAALSVAPDQLNLVIVNVVNLRADRLGAYGAVRPVSMGIDRVAAAGTVFTNAYAAATSGRGETEALFSGLHASAGGSTAGVNSLPALLRRAGWRTAALTQDREPPAGFDFARAHPASLESLVDGAMGWLDANGNRPFFLYVEVSRLTPPFNPPPPFHEMFSRGYDGPIGYSADEIELAALSANDFPDPKDVEHARALYDSEIMYTDATLGRLFRRLREKPLKKKTVIVVVSGHGQPLGEHRRFGDKPPEGKVPSETAGERVRPRAATSQRPSARAFAPTVRTDEPVTAEPPVPAGSFGPEPAPWQEGARAALIIRVPGVAPGTIGAPVSLVDVAPTLLDILGAGYRRERMGGVSFADAVLGAARPPARAVLVEMSADALPMEPGNLKALAAGKYKFIRRTPKGAGRLNFNTLQNIVYFTRGRALYDLATDPNEKNDLAPGDPAAARYMEKLLDAEMKKAWKPRGE